MPVNVLIAPTVSIRCDDCYREWTTCREGDAEKEMEEATGRGWIFRTVKGVVVCCCSQCKGERQAQWDALNG